MWLYSEAWIIWTKNKGAKTERGGLAPEVKLFKSIKFVTLNFLLPSFLPGNHLLVCFVKVVTLFLLSFFSRFFPPPPPPVTPTLFSCFYQNVSYFFSGCVFAWNSAFQSLSYCLIIVFKSKHNAIYSNCRKSHKILFRTRRQNYEIFVSNQNIFSYFFALLFLSQFSSKREKERNRKKLIFLFLFIFFQIKIVKKMGR